MRRPLALGGLPLGTRPLVVAAGGEGELPGLANATGADVVELRADLFDDPRPEGLVTALGQLRAAGRPILLTVRSAAEGGTPWPDDRRAALYAAGMAHVDAVDVEIASRDLAADVLSRARAAGRLVILSAHDFAGDAIARRAPRPGRESAHARGRPAEARHPHGHDRGPAHAPRRHAGRAP